jgi:hypothetical protein
MRRLSVMTRVLMVAAALALAAGQAAGTSASPSAGHDLKRSVHDDHVPPAGPPSTLVAENFDVLGHSNLGGGSPQGDVYFFDPDGTVGKQAYVGTWSSPCSGVGAKIVDVNDPTRPKLVSYAGWRTCVSNEDLVVQRIGARDVLAIGVQPCKGQGGTGGLA